MKNFCFVKDTVRKMKRQSAEWEKIFVNQTSYKVLFWRVHFCDCYNIEPIIK